MPAFSAALAFYRRIALEAADLFPFCCAERRSEIPAILLNAVSRFIALPEKRHAPFIHRDIARWWSFFMKSTDRG